jgi:hypothetical protein
MAGRVNFARFGLEAEETFTAQLIRIIVYRVIDKT